MLAEFALVLALLHAEPEPVVYPFATDAQWAALRMLVHELELGEPDETWELRGHDEGVELVIFPWVYAIEDVRLVTMRNVKGGLLVRMVSAPETLK